jgi:hypothetical protein
LERRLKAQLFGEVEFDAFTRGRYATDASHYQIMPIGVVASSSAKEVEYTLALAREEGASVTARTSQSSQTVNSTLIVDCSKHLDRVLELRHPEALGRLLPAEPRRASPASAAWSSPASCSTTSTVASSRTGYGSRSTSRPPRAPPSAAWSATIPVPA